jgi:hypothetical protein
MLEFLGSHMDGVAVFAEVFPPKIIDFSLLDGTQNNDIHKMLSGRGVNVRQGYGFR